MDILTDAVVSPLTTALTRLLALLALAAAVRDTLAKPENSELHRRALVQRLTIIQSGCLAERDSTKEVPYA